MKWFILVLLLLFVISACDDKEDFQLPSDTFTKQPILPAPPKPEAPKISDSLVDIEGLLYNDIIPGIGASEKFGDGPWNHRILVGESFDSKAWTRVRAVLSDQASNPEAIIDKEGKIRVYYVDAKNEGTTVAIWHKNSWVYKKMDLEEDVEDMSVVIDGDKYRIYYEINNVIYSGSSVNGIYFESEPGLRYSGSDIDGFDVFKVDTIWKMIVSENGSMIMLTSNNGLQFENPVDLNLEGFGIDVLKLEDKYRMYYHALYGTKISAFSASSNDSITWAEDSGVRLYGALRFDRYGINSPTVVPYEDKYRMFYYSQMN
ncbi:hypothetical protein ACFLZX_05705 [Nanoarchaeota archaeon]